MIVKGEQFKNTCNVKINSIKVRGHINNENESRKLFKNGQLVFEGIVKQNKPYKGTLSCYCINDKIYNGVLDGDKDEFNGTVEHVDSIWIREGKFIGGKLLEGKYKTADAIYEGTFTGEHINGWYTNKETGDVFKGVFKPNRYLSGTLFTEDGIVYSGMFNKDNEFINGSIYQDDKKVYEGTMEDNTFVSGSIDGYKSKHGYIINGEMIDGVFCGTKLRRIGKSETDNLSYEFEEGKIIYCDRELFNGIVKNGEPYTGNLYKYYKDPYISTGEIKDGLFEGIKKYNKYNTKIIKEGKFNSEGDLINGIWQENGIEYQGIFDQNMLQAGCKTVGNIRYRGLFDKDELVDGIIYEDGEFVYEGKLIEGVPYDGNAEGYEYKGCKYYGEFSKYYFYGKREGGNIVEEGDFQPDYSKLSCEDGIPKNECILYQGKLTNLETKHILCGCFVDDCFDGIIYKLTEDIDGNTVKYMIYNGTAIYSIKYSMEYSTMKLLEGELFDYEYEGCVYNGKLKNKINFTGCIISDDWKKEGTITNPGGIFGKYGNNNLVKGKWTNYKTNTTCEGNFSYYEKYVYFVGKEYINESKYLQRIIFKGSKRDDYYVNGNLFNCDINGLLYTGHMKDGNSFRGTITTDYYVKTGVFKNRSHLVEGKWEDLDRDIIWEGTFNSNNYLVSGKMYKDKMVMCEGEFVEGEMYNGYVNSYRKQELQPMLTGTFVNGNFEGIIQHVDEDDKVCRICTGVFRSNVELYGTRKSISYVLTNGTMSKLDEPSLLYDGEFKDGEFVKGKILNNITRNVLFKGTKYGGKLNGIADSFVMDNYICTGLIRNNVHVEGTRQYLDGVFENGTFDKSGYMVKGQRQYPNGDIYAGDIKCNRGILICKEDGRIYRGRFSSTGKFEEGVISEKGKTIFEGLVKNRCPIRGKMNNFKFNGSEDTFTGTLYGNNMYDGKIKYGHGRFEYEGICNNGDYDYGQIKCADYKSVMENFTFASEIYYVMDDKKYPFRVFVNSDVLIEKPIVSELHIGDKIVKCNIPLEYIRDDLDKRDVDIRPFGMENCTMFELIEYLYENIPNLSDDVCTNIISNRLDGELFFDNTFTEECMRELGFTELNLFHFKKL